MCIKTFALKRSFLIQRGEIKLYLAVQEARQYGIDYPALFFLSKYSSEAACLHVCSRQLYHILQGECFG